MPTWFNVDIHIDAGTAADDVNAGVPAAEVKVQAANLRGRTVTLIWDGIGSGDIYSHFSFVNYTGGVVDDTWTAADFAAVEARLDTWWTGIKDNYGTALTWRGGRWHRVGQGVTPPNPQVRAFVRAVPGSTGGGIVPPQVASTISFHTALRRQWGRTYLGPPAQIALQSNGRFTSTYANDIADNTATLLEGCITDEFMPVVWSAKKQAMYGVRSIVVDDVPDTIRRRRFDVTGMRASRPT